MTQENQEVVRYPSISSWFLRIIGAVLFLSGIATIILVPGGVADGSMIFIGGVVLFGLGSLCAGLRDVVYELRLIRQSPSNHSANQGDVGQ